MQRFDAPIDKFYRNGWYRFSLSALEWTYRGDLNVSGTLKVKLQKTSRGWSYHVHRASGGLNYVVTIGRPMSNPNHVLLSGMLWVEHHFTARNGPAVARSKGASVVVLADYRARVAEQRSVEATRAVPA